MTPTEFKYWLQGFVEALREGPGVPDSIAVLDKITEKMEEVTDEPDQKFDAYIPGIHDLIGGVADGGGSGHQFDRHISVRRYRGVAGCGETFSPWR